ncbi:hypothetical protein HA402_002800 [Bradysia odoriphaga]|nr:hypothetical protein HA402_002800 [Bradysia odoriphaga]
MYKSIIALLLVATVVRAGEIEWGDCESDMAYVSSVSLTGCSSAPCDLVKGQSYTIGVNALAVHDSSTLPYQIIFWSEGNIVYVTPIPQGNVCNQLSLGSCPYLSLIQISFGVGFTVPYWLSDMEVDVNLLVRNDAEDDQYICVLFKGNVVSAKR